MSTPFKFYKTVVYMAIGFVVFVTLVEAVFSSFSDAGINGFLQNFTNPLIVKYAISKLVGGLIYGVIMAFILKRKAQKR